MDFVSIEFLVWSLLFLAVSWISPHKYSKYILSLFGLSFLFVKVPLAGAILLSEALLCYFISRKQKQMKWQLVVLAIVLIFGAFLLCKYYSGKYAFVFPIGISYFTFRLIHYVQDRFRNRIRDHSFVEFLAYISFFPTYLVGPINGFPDFLTNLRRRKWDAQRFSSGLERAVYGYAQLIILGNFALNYLLKNWLALHVVKDDSFSSMCVYSIHMWLDLYLRFSAYSSIAIGISAMAGFQIIENFNYPFMASNIRDFWQRWHMSLTNWCREYIFTPLAAITRKPFIAIAATMITIGVWHELSFRYILWGVYHALGIIVFEKYSSLLKGKVPSGKTLASAQKVVGIIITLTFVVLSFPVTTIINNYIISLIK